MKWSKNIRIVLWLGLIVIGVLLIARSRISQESDVIITFVSENSPCRDVITEGSSIKDINGMRIKTSDNFYRLTQDLEGITTFIVDGNPRSCNIPKGSVLNMTVKDVKTSWLKFGIDVSGGMMFLLRPEKDVSVETILSTLEYRAKEYGLQNTKLEKIGDSVRVITGLEEENEVKKIIKQGVFEAKLTETINFEDGKGKLVLNDKTYEIGLENDRIIINESVYEITQSFVLDGIEIEIENITKNTTLFLLNVFDDNDVIGLSGEESGRIVKQPPGYVFIFGVQFSEEGSKKFAKATKGREMAIDPGTGEGFLKNPLIILVDGERLLDLPLRGVDAGVEKADLVIWGYRTRMEDAKDDMLRLISVLKSKRLPTKLNIMESGVVLPVSNKIFLDSMIFVVLTTSVLVSVIGFLRYKKILITFVMLSISLSEIILIMGVVSSRMFALLIVLSCVGIALLKDVRDWVSGFTLFLMFLIGFKTIISSWVFDLSSTVGLIGAIILGNIQTIIVANSIFSLRKSMSIPKSQKLIIKNVWVFVSLVVLLMVPLFFLIDAMKGFSMTMIMGFTIATTITKPAYITLIQKFKKD